MTTVRLFGFGLYATHAMELTGLGLRAGSVDLTATGITASHQPVSGSLESLLDADLHTGCTFWAADATSPGFYIDITVSEASADAVRIGSGAEQQSFVRHLSMGVVEAGRLSQPMTLDEIDWPGAHASVVAGGGDSFFSSVALLLPMHADLLDKGPGSVSVSKQGAGAIVADSAAWGGAALVLDGSTGLYTSTAGPWAFLHDNTTPYTVEIDFLYAPSSSGQALVCTSVTSVNAGFFLGVLPSGAPYCAMYKGDGVAVLRADASKAATAGQYNTLKLTYMRDRSLRMELNGEIVFSGLWPIESGSWDTFAQGAPVNPLCVGVGRLNGNWLIFTQGRICELRISKVARPAGSKSAAFPTSGAQGVHSPALLVAAYPIASLKSETEPALQGLQRVDAHRASKLLDAECGGQGRIYGTVARKNTPANVPLRRRVRLHRSVDGYLARETWSKADGSYEFREISTRYEWDVIAWDHELQEYSTVANNQLAEVA